MLRTTPSQHPRRISTKKTTCGHIMVWLLRHKGKDNLKTAGGGEGQTHITSALSNMKDDFLAEMMCGRLTRAPCRSIHFPIPGTCDYHLITGIPHFLKVRFVPLHSYERPTLIPVFVNWKKPKEDFHCSKKRQKLKQRPAFVLLWAEAQQIQRTPQVEWPLPQDLHSASQRQATWAPTWSASTCTLSPLFVCIC